MSASMSLVSLVPTAFAVALWATTAAPCSAQTFMVKANLDDVGETIPYNFVGFSDEVPDVIADTVFTPGNTSLISLLQLLGPNGVMRIGGSASDSGPPPA